MKRRFYPKYIKIGNTKYAVSFARHVSADHTDRGICDLKDKQILLKDNMGEKLTFETFLHETLHGISQEYNYEIPHALIHRLEESFAKFLRDNFHIIPKH